MATKAAFCLARTQEKSEQNWARFEGNGILQQRYLGSLPA
jgi:hypothetical protein